MEIRIQTIGEAVYRYRQSRDVAVICDGRTLTYQELWGAGTAIAANLIQRGVKKGDRVVLDIERSEKYICMVAGIALAGGIIVYIHRGWPAMQKENVIRDCSPALIVRDDMIPELLTLPAHQTQDSIAGILPRVKGEDPFQIVYTSGSTGKPKGAVLCHLVAANISMPAGRNRLSRLDVETCKRRLLDSDFSFVSNSIVMLRALFNERTMVVATKEDLSSVSSLAALCKREGIDKVSWTPSRILKLLAEPEMAEAAGKIRVMTVMGEKIPERIKDLLAKYMPDTAVFCGYGMSEMMHIEDHPYVFGKENLFEYGSENIGLHVLDENGNPVAEGEKGELCVSGIPASLGYYWNDKGQTEQKYTRHPRLGRIFHTGDLAVADRNGSFHLAGRGDQMAKLRGMRIDMDAITQSMFEFPGIREAVPMILGEGEAQTLAAFYTCSRDDGKDRESSHDQECFEQELRSFLSDRLPYYMVPALLMELSQIPLNYNGKTDRLALAAITPSRASYRPAGTELERVLCELFARVLKLPAPCGADDSFFVLGGDSMSGMELAALLEKKGIPLKLKWLFAAPTPALLAQKILMSDRNIEKVGEPDALPPLPAWTPAQREAVLEYYDAEEVECLYPVARNVETRLRRGDAWMLTDFVPVDYDETIEERLRLRLAEMTGAHQALRSVFLFPEGERPVQAVLKKYEIPFVFCDYTKYASDRDGVKEGVLLSQKQKELVGRTVLADAAHKTDLMRGPFYRVKLIRTGADKAILYISYSHAVMDGEGQTGAIQELLGKTQITSDREILNRHFCRNLYAPREAALSFWREQGFTGTLTALPAPSVQDAGKHGPKQSFQAAGTKLLQELSQYCRKSSLTMASVLHYCLGRAVLKLLNLTTCSFLTVTNGRTRTEKGIPGFFAHEIPFLYHKGDTIKDCQEQLLAAGEHAWIFSIPDTAPSLGQGGNVLFLDVINVYTQDTKRLPLTQALDGQSLGMYMASSDMLSKKTEKIAIHSSPGMGRLCHGIYDPSTVDKNFMKELAKQLTIELQNVAASASAGRRQGGGNEETLPAYTLKEPGKEGEGRRMFAIWGTGELSVKMFHRLSETEQSRVCFVVPDDAKGKEADPKLPVVRLKELSPENVEKVLIPSRGVLWAWVNEKTAWQKIQETTGIGDDRLWVMDYASFDRELKKNGSLDAFLKSDTIPYLLHLEYEVTHHCNLNCRACSHFTPLTEKKFGNLDQFVKDLEKIHTMVDNIGEIQLLGGEPLLNPELHKFILEARRIYPYAAINVVTNGILLGTIGKRLIETMKWTGAAFIVTVYPPFKDYAGKMIRQLEESGVLFREGVEAESFYSWLIPDGNSNPKTAFAKCMQTNCCIFENGKFSRCSIVHKIPVYENYYQLDHGYPDCSLNLYAEELTPVKLQSYLMHPVEMCRFCGKPAASPWARAGKNPQMEDWCGQEPY